MAYCRRGWNADREPRSKPIGRRGSLQHRTAQFLQRQGERRAPVRLNDFPEVNGCESFPHSRDPDGTEGDHESSPALRKKIVKKHAALGDAETSALNMNTYNMVEL